MAAGSKTPGKQQTLFSFFKQPATPTPNPPPQPKPTQPAPIQPAVKPTTPETSQQATRRIRKRISYQESDEEDNAPVLTDKKRKVRPIISDDDSGDEFVPDETTFQIDADDFDCTMFSDEEVTTTSTTPTSVMSPIQDRFKKFTMDSPGPPSPLSRRTNSNTTTTKEEKQKGKSKAFKEKNESRYSWLSEVRDANGNSVDSPDYDPRTLYIPASAWKNFTPFEKQFWEIKSKQWDSVVFFKKGKFYELYEKDADLGHQHFDLKMTDRVNMRMVGVPESSFDHWASQFVAKGYKVARVDQMENAIGKSLREKAALSKEDKVIRRELTSVLTAGTLVDAGLLTDDMGTYCMSIKEYCPDDQSEPIFGICFVDTSTAEFNLATFQDDKNRTKLETLIMQIKPRELVTEKGRLSATTTRLLKNCLINPYWNMLIPETEFWDGEVTADEIRIGGYFNEESSDIDMESNDNWPPVLQTAAKTAISLSAVGGLIWYLRSLKLDKQLLSARNFKSYDPIQNSTSLVLDGQTLANLEIFENSVDGSIEGTLFKLLNNCITPFGKRLFKQWLCHPLRLVPDIRARQDAVEDMMRITELQDRLAPVFTTLPDLERLISRIHSKRCTVTEFLTTIEGFKNAKSLIDTLRPLATSFESTLLQSLIAQFPSLDEQLVYFADAFIITEIDIDYRKMKVIIPKKGVNNEWDDLNDEIESLEKTFNKHLAQMKLELNRLEYKDLGKEIYQIEVPKNVSVPKDWISMSATSKVKRYWNPTLRELIPQYKEKLEIKSAYTKNFTTQVYGEFDKDYPMWQSAVYQLAQLDALLGLTHGSLRLAEPACRPEFIDDDKSVLDVKDLRHPCLATGDFIPNDTLIGGTDQPNIIVLTGPNMGGKSTLLRQTCVVVIMAQMGGYVPARSCRMTPCDRIYTRIGANDNILAGQSTFMVELAETSKILQEATPRSMVILDELGRGTSTFDGYAIAYSVLHHLANYIGCLTLFSTHYHTLCQEFDGNRNIKNMHMGYLMDDDEHRVVFLYKLMEGICGKSFGMNVAKMAGIPDEIIIKASERADDFEKTHRQRKTTNGPAIPPTAITDLAYLMNGGNNARAVRSIINSFQSLV
ncbi:muts domain V-domain-containing protein [Chlamydoabsidia padenii]|nr:muts domain V-domain-containing protein [Chlamydoabsidia padenii]